MCALEEPNRFDISFVIITKRLAFRLEAINSIVSGFPTHIQPTFVRKSLLQQTISDENWTLDNDNATTDNEYINWLHVKTLVM